jgi:mannitol-1-phosphate/altronate dehydrogenase
MDVKEVFGEDLPKNPAFTKAVEDKFAALCSDGSAVAIRKFA